MANRTEDRRGDKGAGGEPDGSTAQLAIKGRKKNPFGIAGKVGFLIKRIAISLRARNKRD